LREPSKIHSLSPRTRRSRRESLPWDNDFAPECTLLFDKEDVLSYFTSIAAANASAFTVGGIIAITKIAQAYAEYSRNKKDIENKDLYFYYKAGDLIEI
jgi:hypothetical protein